MKNRYCKICGEYSGKRNVCLNCKTKYPYQPAASRNQTENGGLPFARKDRYLKEKQKEEKI